MKAKRRKPKARWLGSVDGKKKIKVGKKRLGKEKERERERMREKNGIKKGYPQNISELDISMCVYGMVL